MKFMVLDGNSIINRAFFGIRMLTAPDGTPTNAVYGFLATLQKQLEEEQPGAVCVTFDRPEPTFRHMSYEGYKAKRREMPQELAVQMPKVKALLDACGICRCELSGFEADDIIGSICQKCTEEGWECIIVTGDKDAFQLISDGVRVKHVRTRMGQTETIDYDRARFIEEYGIEPLRIIDLKALMGDASDNIPGVPGVGEKTALELLRRFGSLDAIYEKINASDIKDAVRKKLIAGEDSARLSQGLARIDTKAPIDLMPADTVWDGRFGCGLYDVLKSLGFSRFIEKWGLKPGENPSADTERPEIIASNSREITLDALVAVFDSGEYNGVSIYDGKRYCEIPAWADESAFLKEVLSGRVKKVSHNVKDLMRRALEMGIDPDGFTFDTSLASYLLDPTENSYGLDRITQKYLGRPGSGSPEVYCLTQVLDKALRERSLERLYYDVELPLCRVLADMELAGFAVDKSALCEFGENLNKDIETTGKNVWELAGESFNINSPKQMGEILFERLRLPHGKKTKTGWSTSAQVLESLTDKHPIIEKILDYRQLTKLKSTYADGLLKLISPDGRIRTSFQMTVTATGRLSSTEPNLQNIPVRSPLGGEIRKMFVAAPGNLLVDADYSQIELRLLAHISGDETMKRAFSEGEDIHTVTASQVFGVPLSDVSPLMRSRAKAVNFGIVYGISDFSLAKDIGVTKSQARTYIDNYLEKYSGVRKYMSEIVERAKADGYVATIFGRRRAIPELSSSNYNIRSFGERVALNMPIQGSAADIIKLAMVNAHARLKKEGLRSRLILQVHDELIAECPEDEAERVAGILENEMLGAASLSVPLIAEAHCGKNWYEAK